MAAPTVPPYERGLVTTLVDRLLGEGPPRIITVSGPRQSGKTTIVDQALARIRRTSNTPTLYCATDDPRRPAPAGEASVPSDRKPGSPPDPDWIIRNWDEARAHAERAGNCVLVFDEIQEIPRWSSIVKGLWDADRGLARRPQVVVLGSAPLRIQSGLTESLVGRFEPYIVPHWSLREMTEAFGFDLSRYLFFGGYPGMAGRAVEGDEEEWRRYVLLGCVRPTLDRDILALTRVDKPALMKQLFEMSAFYSGQIVSFTKLLGHLRDAGNTTTLARYLDLLEAVGLVAGLSGYAPTPVGRRSTPKLIVLDPALMTAPSRYDFREALADRSFWGRVVESAVGAHLYHTKRLSAGLSYWRSRGREVDFVLERGPHLLAIEVKSGAFRGSHSGLDAFRERYPRARTLLVGEGGVPLIEFLSEPAEHWLSEIWD